MQKNDTVSPCYKVSVPFQAFTWYYDGVLVLSVEMKENIFI